VCFSGDENDEDVVFVRAVKQQSRRDAKSSKQAVNLMISDAADEPNFDVCPFF
jgi:hypothetical protein